MAGDEGSPGADADCHGGQYTFIQTHSQSQLSLARDGCCCCWK